MQFFKLPGGDNVFIGLGKKKKSFTIDFRSFQKGKGLESSELVCTKQTGTPDRSVFLVFKMAF